MDEADIANETAEKTLRSQLASCKKPSGPTPTGRCHYCDEVVADGVRWCGVECRSDWEREQALGARRGT